MKRFDLFILLMVVVVLSGCAGSSTSLKPNTPSEYRGLTKAQLVAKYGEPCREATDFNGNQLLEFRSPTSSKGVMNNVLSVTSFGTYKGCTAAYVDMLRCVLSPKGIVQSCSFEENLMSVTIPSLTGGSIIEAKSITPAPAIVEEKKVPVPEPPVARENPRNISAKTAQDFSLGILLKMSRTCNSPPATVSKGVTRVAHNNGMSVTQEKSGGLLVKTSSGPIATLHAKASKKRTTLELLSEGNINQQAFGEFSMLLTACE